MPRDLGLRRVQSAIAVCAAPRKVLRARRDGHRYPSNETKHLETTLIESAKVTPRDIQNFRCFMTGEKQKGNRNRATRAIARKLVRIYLAPRPRALVKAMLRFG